MRFQVSTCRGFLRHSISGRTRYGLTAIVTDSVDCYRVVGLFRSEDTVMFGYLDGRYVPGVQGDRLALLRAETFARRLNRARPPDLVL